MSAKPLILCALVAAFIVLPSLPSAVTQENPPEPNSSDNSASLNEEQEVTDLISQADKESSDGNWEDAALLYQQAAEKVLEEYPSCVYKAAGASKAGLELYVSAYDYCQRRLLKMDERSLESYREKYESMAADALNRAVREVDLDKMYQVGERYPCTESGLKGLQNAGDLAAERGDYVLAARCYRKAVEIRAAVQGQNEETRPGYALLLAKAVSAYVSMGWESDVKAIVNLVAADAGLSGFEIMASGKKVTLGAFVDETAKSLKHETKTSVNGYPMIGGDASHSLLMPAVSGEIGDIKWKYEVAVEQNMKMQWQQGPQNRMAMLPYYLSRLPVVGDGIVLLDTGSTTVAISENDGKEVYKFPVGTADGNMQMNYGYYNMGSYHSCTIHDGLAYTSILAPQIVNNWGNMAISGPLYAIDVHTGKQVWDSTGASGIPKDERVSGAPVAFGNRLVFITQKGGNGQVDCYMNCVDAKTGKLEWRCYVASGFTNMVGPAGLPQFPDSVAVEGDAAIVASAAGVIAAVDVRTGQLMWVAKYPQDLLDPAMNGQVPFNQARRWCFNYPIAVNGHVIVQPQDSTCLCCLDTATGQVKWMQKIPDMRYLAGVDEGEIFVIEKAVMIIDENTGKLVFRGDELGETPEGRPALTKTDLYISTDVSLLRFDRKEKKVARVKEWAAKGLEPGNLLLTEETLYVVNAGSVFALNGPGLLDRLREKVEKDPANALLLYRYGDTLSGQEKYDEALTNLQKAMSQVKPEEQYAGRPLRDLISESLYKCCINFSAQHAAQNRRDEALKYADLAFKYAIDDKARLMARVSTAGIYEKSEDEQSWRSAVDFYQKVILELPRVFSEFGGPYEQCAALFAANHIDAIIAAHGRNPYAGVEAEAAKALADAQVAGNNAAYLKVYQQYPNSLAALDALTRLAKQFEAGNSKFMALIALTAASERFSKSGESAPANLMLYRIALERGRYDLAHKALDRLAAMPPELQAEIDGKMTAVAAYAQEKTKELEALIASPAAGVPIGDNPQLARNIKLEGAGNDLLDADGLAPAHLADKLLIRRGGIVECWNPETGEKVWTSGTSGVWIGVELAQGADGAVIVQNVIPGQPAQAAGLQPGDRLDKVNGKNVTSPEECREALAGLKPGDKVKITYTRNNVGQEVEVAVAAAPPSNWGAVLSAFYADDGNIVLRIMDLRSGGIEIRCIDGKTGETVWSRSTRTPANALPGLAESHSRDAIGLIEQDNNGAWIHILESANGKVAARIQLAQKNYMGNVVVGSDSALVLETNPYVCHVYDILTGDEKCRVPIGSGNYNISATPVALVGNLLVFSDENILRAVNVSSGEIVYMQNDQNNVNSYGLATSERYIVIYRQGGNQAMILDSATNKLVVTLNAVRIYNQPSLFGDRLFLIVLDDRGQVATNVYDAQTGKLVSANIPVGQDFFGRSVRVVGEYAIAVGVQVRDQKEVVIAKIFDYMTGKQVFSCEQPARNPQGGVIVEQVTVVNGKICVLRIDEIGIYK